MKNLILWDIALTIFVIFLIAGLQPYHPSIRIGFFTLAVIGISGAFWIGYKVDDNNSKI